MTIGGFSQGAMLTMDTALRGKIQQPQLLLQFSGTVICESEWKSGMTSLHGVKVYQAHGTLDPILPYASAEYLRDLMLEAEIDLQFHSFAGPHTIDPESLATTVQLIRQTVASSDGPG